MTPIYVHELGNYDYGIWEILISIVGYLGLLDMGLRPTISRFIAYYWNSENINDQQEIFSTTLCLMGILGVFIGTLFVLWSFVGAHLLSPDPDSSWRYAYVLRIFALHVLFSFPYFALESTFEGRLNYATKNNIKIAHSIINACILYNLLVLYDPLLLLVTMNAIMTFSKFFIFYTLLNTKSYGNYRFHFMNFNPSLVIRMLGFGSKAMVQGVAGIVSKRSMPVIIGGFLGPQKIVFYQLAYMLIRRVSDLTRILGHAFLPVFATMVSKGDQLGIERYFFNGTKYIYAITAASCLGIGVIGSSFISLWIGPEYGEAARPLIWMMVASSLIAGSLPLHNRLLMALNRHGQLSILYMIRAILIIILAVILIIPLNLIGVVLATLMSQTIIAPFIWRTVFKQLYTSPLYYLRHNIGPSLLSATLMATIVYVYSQINEINTWLSLISSILIGLLAFIPLFLLLAIQHDDWNMISNIWKRGRQAIKAKLFI
jgi:O-antigen/teichoic acid export membrane protein